MNNKRISVYLICTLPTTYSCLVCNICLRSSSTQIFGRFLPDEPDDTRPRPPVFEMSRCYRCWIQFSRRNTVKRLNRVWNIDFTTRKVWILPVLLLVPALYGVCVTVHLILRLSAIFSRLVNGENPDLSSSTRNRQEMFNFIR